MRSACVILSLLLIATCMPIVADATTPGQGWMENLYACLTYPPGTYGVGDRIPITVHVLLDEEYTSVDDVKVEIASQTANSREGSVEEVEMGRWRGEITVRESDSEDGVAVDGPGSYIRIGIDVVIGTRYKAFINLIFLEHKDIDQLVLVPSMERATRYVRPEETRTITWLSYYKGELIDMEKRYLDIRYADVHLRDLETERVSKGTYRYTFKAPSSNESLVIDISFSGVYTTVDNETVYDESITEFNLFLNFFHVWAHTVGEVTGGRAVFDLFVSDVWGNPIELADVLLEFSYNGDGGRRVSRSTGAVSDGDGVARVTLDYADLHPAHYIVWVEGTVAAQCRTQHLEFEFTARLPTGFTQDMGGPDFGVMCTSPMPVSFGRECTYEGRVYWNGTPLPGQHIFYDVRTPYDLVAHGTLVASPVGDISFKFRTPEKPPYPFMRLGIRFWTMLEMIAEPDYSFYEVEMFVTEKGTTYPGGLMDLSILASSVDPEMRVDVGVLKEGSSTGVDIVHPDADQCWSGTVSITGGSDGPVQPLVPTWSYWTMGPRVGTYTDAAVYDEGKFNGSVFIPKGLPSEDWTVIAMLNDEAHMQYGVIDYAECLKFQMVTGLKVGSGGSAGGEEEDAGDGFEDQMNIMVSSIIVLVVIGILFRSWERATRRK